MTNTRLSPAAQTRLVAAREIRTRLQSKAFVVSMLILIFISWIAAALPALSASNVFNVANTDSSEVQDIAVVAETSDILPVSEYREVVVSDTAEAIAKAQNGDVVAALVPADNPSGLKVYGADQSSEKLVSLLTVQPDFEPVGPAATQSGVNSLIPYLGGIIFGILFLIGVTAFGTFIASSIVEEKSSRIVEILLAATGPRSLMFGKIIGNAAIAFTVIALVIGGAGIILSTTDIADLFTHFGAALTWFVPLFIAGFLVMATLYAGAGALISRQEDLGSITSPMMIIAMIPYFAVIMFGENNTIMTVLSYVPFAAPVAMPQRLLTENAAAWEPFAALFLQVIAIILLTLVCARVYENSILQIGGKVKLKDALRA